MRDQLMTSNRQDWETPKWLFNRLDDIFHFDLDAAADSFSRKCSRYIAPDYGFYGENYDATSLDAIINPWPNFKTAWLNPPYGPNLLPFMKKVRDEYHNKDSTIVCLTPARTETKFFRIAWTYARYFIFLYGRLKFELDGVSQQSATYPSVISIFSPRKWNLEPLKEHGKIIEQNILTKKEIYSLEYS